MNIIAGSMKDLQQLVAGCDDNAGNHIVWLDLNGDVRISCLAHGELPNKWAELNKDKFKCRVETLQRGNGYVGTKAAEDHKWMKDLYGMLQEGSKMQGLGHYIG